MRQNIYPSEGNSCLWMTVFHTYVDLMIATHNNQRGLKTGDETSPNSALRNAFRGMGISSEGLPRREFIESIAALSLTASLTSCKFNEPHEVPSQQSPVLSTEQANVAKPEPLKKSLLKPEGIVQTKVISKIRTTEPVFFITIDDGYTINDDLLKLMEKHHIPITAFLISSAMENHKNYWKDFSRLGGLIEDHTVDHLFLTRLTYQSMLFQIKGCEDAISNLIGVRPVMMRPPGGFYNNEVLKATAQAGIPYLVMWGPDVENKEKGYTAELLNEQRPKLRIMPGDIVLLHWVPKLYAALEMVMENAYRNNLGPGNLLDHIHKIETEVTSSHR